MFPSPRLITWILAGVLVCAAGPASSPSRAEDAAAEETAQPEEPSVDDPLTNKEKRQLKRKERKRLREQRRAARRRKKALDQKSRKSMDRALKSAGIAADALKSSMGPSMGELGAEGLGGSLGDRSGSGGLSGQGAAGGPPGAFTESNALPPGSNSRSVSAGAPGMPGASGANPSAVKKTGAWAPGPSSGDPADPGSVDDLINASGTGYSTAFASTGLKMAADGRTIVRISDGKPADEQDLARLRQMIVSMPRALVKRPGMFKVIRPKQYAALKSAYNRQDALPQNFFKHVGTTEEERDFIRTNSCQRLSGDCNPAATEDSYKKGDFVSPEDLKKMWESLQEALDVEDDDAMMGFFGSLPERTASFTANVNPMNRDDKPLSTGLRDGDSREPKTQGSGARSAPTTSLREIFRPLITTLSSGGTDAKGDRGGLLPLAAIAAGALAGAWFFLRRPQP